MLSDPWFAALSDAVAHEEWWRAGMLVWAALFTVGSAGVAGHRVDLFLLRQWGNDVPPWYPPDAGAWCGLAAGLIVTARSTFGL